MQREQYQIMQISNVASNGYMGYILANLLSHDLISFGLSIHLWEFINEIAALYVTIYVGTIFYRLDKIH